MGNSYAAVPTKESQPVVMKLGRPNQVIVRGFTFQDGDECWIKADGQGSLRIVDAVYDCWIVGCLQEVAVLLSPYVFNGNEIKFLVNPSTIGVDPCPGWAKRLKIQVRLS